MHGGLILAPRREGQGCTSALHLIDQASRNNQDECTSHLHRLLHTCPALASGTRCVHPCFISVGEYTTYDMGCIKQAACRKSGHDKHDKTKLATQHAQHLHACSFLQRGLQFVEKTGFPADRLLADPDNVTYNALGFKKGIKETFFSWEVGAGSKLECVCQLAVRRRVPGGDWFCSFLLIPTFRGVRKGGCHALHTGLMACLGCIEHQLPAHLWKSC